jgi:hypothetical protein
MIIMQPYTAHNGTCEDATFARGFGQKIVSFTFFEPPTAADTTVDEDKRLDRMKRNYFLGIRFVLIENKILGGVNKVLTGAREVFYVRIW